MEQWCGYCKSQQIRFCVYLHNQKWPEKGLVTVKDLKFSNETHEAKEDVAKFIKEQMNAPHAWTVYKK